VQVISVNLEDRIQQFKTPLRPDIELIIHCFFFRVAPLPCGNNSDIPLIEELKETNIKRPAFLNELSNLQ
jgi:hypothetical protein